jgi:hypothetical protein
VILSCSGQRTMRTCLEGAAALTADDLLAADFAGAAWAFFSAYGMYQRGLLPRAICLAKQVSCSIVYLGVEVAARWASRSLCA